VEKVENPGGVVALRSDRHKVALLRPLLGVDAERVPQVRVAVDLDGDAPFVLAVVRENGKLLELVREVRVRRPVDVLEESLGREDLGLAVLLEPFDLRQKRGRVRRPRILPWRRGGDPREEDLRGKDWRRVAAVFRPVSSRYRCRSVSSGFRVLSACRSSAPRRRGASITR
jgi:hypothetical protein